MVVCISGFSVLTLVSFELGFSTKLWFLTLTMAKFSFISASTKNFGEKSSISLVSNASFGNSNSLSLVLVVG